MFEDARRYTGVAEFDRKLGELLMSKDYARSRYEILRHKIELTRRSPSETTEPAPLAGEASASADPDLGANHVAVIDRGGKRFAPTPTRFTGLDARAAEEIQRRGYTIDWAGPFSKRNAQMTGIDLQTGIRYGAPDPRGEGHAAGQP
jgi:gamma-glutamyltranspeptidase